jgi:hypothetical protein
VRNSPSAILAVVRIAANCLTRIKTHSKRRFIAAFEKKAKNPEKSAFFIESRLV